MKVFSFSKALLLKAATVVTEDWQGMLAGTSNAIQGRGLRSPWQKSTSPSALSVGQPGVADCVSKKGG